MTEVLDARLDRITKSNALRLTFRSGPGDPLAEARQGAADGRGSKIGVLFGFKNGGVGTHVLTYADGRALHVKSQDSKPTLITQADGVEIATVERGESSVARLSGGTGSCGSSRIPTRSRPVRWTRSGCGCTTQRAPRSEPST
jgi:hypothetical protein